MMASADLPPNAATQAAMISETSPRIADDLYRLTGRRSAAVLVKRVLLDPAFRPIVTLRLHQQLAAHGVPAPILLPLRLLHLFVCHAAPLELPIATKVGPALQIAHGFGIVVNGKAVLGANVTLFQGVTIGQGDRIKPDGTRVTGYPVIEDDVWIGPQAIVVGGITVGAGSRIMPGAVVTEDVPPRTMVAGNPGMVVRRDCAPDVARRVDVAAGRAPLASRHAPDLFPAAAAPTRLS